MRNVIFQCKVSTGFQQLGTKRFQRVGSTGFQPMGTTRFEQLGTKRFQPMDSSACVSDWPASPASAIFSASLPGAYRHEEPRRVRPT